MIPNSEIQVRVAEGAEEAVQNSVRIELPAGSDVESLVLAYRRDGEVVEFAERTVPATAELHGNLD